MQPEFGPDFVLRAPSTSPVQPASETDSDSKDTAVHRSFAQLSDDAIVHASGFLDFPGIACLARCSRQLRNLLTLKLTQSHGKESISRGLAALCSARLRYYAALKNLPQIAAVSSNLSELHVDASRGERPDIMLVLLALKPFARLTRVRLSAPLSIVGQPANYWGYPRLPGIPARSLPILASIASLEVTGNWFVADAELFNVAKSLPNLERLRMPHWAADCPFAQCNRIRTLILDEGVGLHRNESFGLPALAELRIVRGNFWEPRLPPSLTSLSLDDVQMSNALVSLPELKSLDWTFNLDPWLSRGEVALSTDRIPLHHGGISDLCVKCPKLQRFTCTTALKTSDALIGMLSHLRSTRALPSLSFLDLTVYLQQRWTLCVDTVRIACDHLQCARPSLTLKFRLFTVEGAMCSVEFSTGYPELQYTFTPSLSLAECLSPD